MAAKLGVRPTGVGAPAMPGVPSGVWPGVNIWMPPKGVAPGLLEGVWPLAPGVVPVGVALGVASAGVASAPGVAPGLSASTGVSSQRARLRLGAPGPGVSPHWPGVGVSPGSSLAPGVVSHLPRLPPSSSSSRRIGVSAPSPTGVSQRSPSSFSAFFLRSPSSSFGALPVPWSQRRFFLSASSPLASRCAASSSRCFCTLRSTSCFSLSSCWPTITSL
mmetsp:Transcript_110035/g.311042  ORF Transcript_110035/g.311042 Transcript_110035/m.311042 type:complete len:218 (-) Transcript_110035:262-915(-)